MKKRITLVLALAMCFALLLTACGQGSTQSNTPQSDTPTSAGTSSGQDAQQEPQTETLNLAYFGPHQDNEYQISLREAVESVCAEEGINVKVYIADNDPAKQISQIEQAIAEGVDGIVIDPVSFEGIESGVQAAKSAGIPFVTVHESVSSQDDCTAFVGSNLKEGGRLKMEQVMADLPDGGQLAVLYGPLGQNAQIDITAGYDEALAGSEDKYPIVFDGVGNWNAEDALDLVSNWLSTGKEIDAIVCNNDGMAIGALQAVQSAGKLDDILIYGLDAQQDVLREVAAGNIRATIFNDYMSEARIGVETCVKAINGEEVEAEVLIDPVVVTADNVDDYIKE